jgi:hypothetical protein
VSLTSGKLKKKLCLPVSLFDKYSTNVILGFSNLVTGPFYAILPFGRNIVQPAYILAQSRFAKKRFV